jgi:hypothetical protein
MQSTLPFQVIAACPAMGGSCGGGGGTSAPPSLLPLVEGGSELLLRGLVT